jgi:DNA-binding response OmpR family regulator
MMDEKSLEILIKKSRSFMLYYSYVARYLWRCGFQMYRILIVEGDDSSRSSLSKALRNDGYLVLEARDGSEARDQLSATIPHLLLLSLSSPQKPQLSLLLSLREEQSTCHIPVVVLGTKSNMKNVLAALNAGADDYLWKSCSFKEIQHRLRILLSSAGTMLTADNFTIGALEIHPSQKSIALKGKAMELTAKEYGLLCYLAGNNHRILSRERLLSKIWGIKQEVKTRTVDVHIRRLREKLGKNCAYIRTVRRVGYRFEV